MSDEKKLTAIMRMQAGDAVGVNGNGRVYPRDLWKREVARYWELLDKARETGKPIFAATQRSHVSSDEAEYFRKKVMAALGVSEAHMRGHIFDKLWISGELIYDRVGDAGELILRGKTIDLVSPEGADMGKACLAGPGKLMVLEDPMDIRIGKEFWFLAGQFDGDPTVAHGAVERYRVEHDRAWIKPRTHLLMKMDNGRMTECYDTDLHLTREAAEAARMKQLEDEQ